MKCFILCSLMWIGFSAMADTTILFSDLSEIDRKYVTSAVNDDDAYFNYRCTERYSESLCKRYCRPEVRFIVTRGILLVIENRGRIMNHDIACGTGISLLYKEAEKMAKENCDHRMLDNWPNFVVQQRKELIAKEIIDSDEFENRIRVELVEPAREVCFIVQ